MFDAAYRDLTTRYFPALPVVKGTKCCLGVVVVVELPQAPEDDSQKR